MVDESKLDIRRVIEQGSQHTTVSNLANMGIRNVRVLDERTILELIRNAVDQVVALQTEEERARLVEESRKQLDRLMAERNEFMTRANMLEAGKNELMQQVEKLQEELKLRRQLEEQSEASFQSQLKEIVERHKGQQKEFERLREENSWLREDHDRLVEELDRAQTEIKRLTRELEELRAAGGELSALREALESARAEAAALSEDAARLREEASRASALAEEVSELRAAAQEAARLREELTRATQDRDRALQDAAALREDLERERAQREESSAAPLAELAEARREAARLKARLIELERSTSRPEAAAPAVPEAPAPQEPPASAAPEAAARPEDEPAHAPVAAAAVPAPRRLQVESARALLASGDLKHGKGLDIGTVNLVAAEQNEQGEVVLRLRRNAFIDVEITPYTKNMLTQLKVPYVVQGKRMYVLGDEAFELANVLNRNTRRPMKDGLISPKEQDALPVMKLLIGSILGEPRVPGEVCFYSVPGDPVDTDLSVAYHRDLFDAVLRALGYKPNHIIEGHAVVFAELADEDFTGIGISCGGGMFNICVAYKSMPALCFSTARSGDWVDFHVAQALGITPVKAALIKEKGVDLVNPKSREEDAISIYYRNLIKYNLTNIAERFRASENMPSFPEPISIVFSGGTAMAGNFIELVKAVFKELDFPIPVKDIRMAKDPLHATAKGALTAAMLEMAQQPA
ncbi:MAG: hypothetical protein ACK44W_08025 [Planctomycetota bacterium]